jgi:hypothetical protein
MQPVANPPRVYVRNLLDPGDVPRGVRDLV